MIILHVIFILRLSRTGLHGGIRINMHISVPGNT